MRRALFVAAVLAAVLPCAPGARAGVVIGATRVVVPSAARDVTVSLSNKRDTPALVEAWIEPEAPGDGAPAFVVAPTLFRMEAGRAQTVRVHRTQVPLPDDRETLFWLHVLDIPPNPTATPDAPQMKIAVRSRIKVFHRPAGLQGDAARAPSRVAWSTVDGRLRIDNPTPFHVVLARVSIGGERMAALDGTTLPPFSQQSFALEDTHAAALREDAGVAFAFVNDAGGSETRNARVTLDAEA